MSHLPVSFAPPKASNAPTKTKPAKAAFLSIIALLLVLTAMPVAQQKAFADDGTTVVLIANHDVWKYDDSNTDLFAQAAAGGAADFRNANYVDTAWKTGASPLGYPVAETSTTFGAVNAGGTLLNKGAQGASSATAYITYYFRKDFNVQDISDITKLEANIAVDDGYVLYLNGNELSRLNMPAGAVGHSTISTDTWEGTEARANVTVDLTAYRQFLVEGTNTLVADVHNRDGNSSDIYWGLSLKAVYAATEPVVDVNKTPKQVNVHVGDEASASVNVTYTTVASDTTKIVVSKADGSGQEQVFNGEASVGSGNKYIHKIPVTGLQPNTDYTYSVGNEVTFAGAFKTAPAQGSQDSVNFIYLADTQVSNATNAKALGATLQEVANMDPDFVYLAGDITDTATNEAQWEGMFYNTGSFPTGGESMFGNYLIAAVQGNHDNNTFNRHINAPTLTSNSIENKIVYAFDYGPITFVMLNLEAARSNANARAEQEAYLRAAIADAHARGQWTAVGFHKSLITGASHVVDSDVIEARKFWVPIFAELDVDLVLQGHDHVYSRGFVDAAGYAAERTTNSDDSVNDPANAPLYMIGGHAGGLKWYNRINYTVGTGDPLAPGYTYLDLNSANPADNADGTPSDVKQEQVIVQMEVSQSEFTINTYMFKYNTTTDTITTDKYLYDTLTVRREVSGGTQPGTAASAEITGPDVAMVDVDDQITYTVAYNDLANANAFDTAVAYNSDELEFVGATSLFDSTNLIFNEFKATDGSVRLQTGLVNRIAQADSLNVVTFTFKAKQPVVVDGTTVQLVQANTVAGVVENGAVVDYVDVAATIDNGSKTTTLYSYRKASDINKDGKVTLADLARALDHYQSTAVEDRIYDIDLSGVVDALDFLIISSFIE